MFIITTHSAPLVVDRYYYSHIAQLEPIAYKILAGIYPRHYHYSQITQLEPFIYNILASMFKAIKLIHVMDIYQFLIAMVSKR